MTRRKGSITFIEVLVFVATIVIIVGMVWAVFTNFRPHGEADGIGTPFYEWHGGGQYNGFRHFHMRVNTLESEILRVETKLDELLKRTSR